MPIRRPHILFAVGAVLLAAVPLGCGDSAPEPTPADHDYVAVLCAAASTFSTELDRIIAERTGNETPAQLINRTAPAMEAWVEAVGTGRPPQDAAAYHAELQAALDLALRRFRDQGQPDALAAMPPIPSETTPATA